MNNIIILTCEHASNAIPESFQAYFANKEKLLATHRGYDIGAKEVFQYLVQMLNAPSVCAKYSRLLIDLNRSLHHAACFSEISKHFDHNQKDRIKNIIYIPYRREVENVIDQHINQNNIVIHISVHSFTPILNNIKRTADIGLLYDPKRLIESRFCRNWKERLHELDPKIIVKRNYPYRGTSDGFVTALRKRYPSNYAGIELEMNQSLLKNLKSRDSIKHLIYQSLLLI